MKNNSDDESARATNRIYGNMVALTSNIAGSSLSHGIMLLLHFFLSRSPILLVGNRFIVFVLSFFVAIFFCSSLFRNLFIHQGLCFRILHDFLCSAYTQYARNHDISLLYRELNMVLL